MKQKRTFRVHARSGRARKKLMNFTGTGAGDIAAKVLKEKTDSEKTAQRTPLDPPERGYWSRFGRGLVGLHDDPRAAQIWQMQAQQFAQQLAQEQGISAEQALPQAMQQMRASGMTPLSLQQQMLETDIGDRSLLTGQVKHWLNPVFNPVLNPGYVASESALQASGVGGEGVGAQLARAFAPLGVGAGMAGLGKLGVPGMSTGGKFFGQWGGKPGKAVGKYLLPLYMGARTVTDPGGLWGIGESLATGRQPKEWSRQMQAMAMRDVLAGKKMEDTRLGGGLQQQFGAAMKPVSWLHDVLPLGDVAGAVSGAAGGPAFSASDWMQEQAAKGQGIGEREAIRGRLTLADLTTGGLGGMLKAYSKSLGNVSGYDPFYRQRWAADKLSRRADAARRRLFRQDLQEGASGYGLTDPEAQSNQLWLSQMKRMGELDPFGAEGTWTRDLLTSSYKPTDEGQTKVDPSKSVWQRSIADAQRLAKERGMSVEQVLMGRDARAAAADEQNARQFLAKAKAVESGNVQGMDPAEVQRIQNFVANTKAQGLPIDEQTAKGFVMQRRRQSDIAGARAAGELPGAQDVGRHGGYSWWRQQLAEGKGYSPYESLSARARVGKGFDKQLFDQLFGEDVIGQIKKTRGYGHAMSGLRGGFSQAQLEQFLGEKDPYELQKVYGMSGRQMRELHQASRQDYVDMMNLANRRLTTGAGRERPTPAPPPETAKATVPTTPQAGSGTYLPGAKKKNTGGGIAAAPQNASGKGDGSRV
jgi:hypothetical protein